jgi:hypothetical protein
MIAYQNRSFARHAGELLVHGRRKHERAPGEVETVGESTNFRTRLALFLGASAEIGSIFVLSATELQAPRSGAA